MSRRKVLRRQALTVIAASLLSAGALAVELDATYGDAGIASSAPGIGTNVAQGVRVAQGGKILLAGTHYSGADIEVAVTRFNADGTADTSFGGDGSVTVNPCQGMTIGFGGVGPNLMAVQNDGKVVIASSCWDDIQGIDLGLVFRLTSAGALDNTFGTNGIALLPATVANNGSSPQAVALTDDGEVIVAGVHGFDQADFQGYLVRLTPSGVLDASFAGGEFLGATLSWFSVVRVMPDDRIMVAGAHGLSPTTADLLVHRFLADGSVDSSLNGTGMLEFNVGDLTSTPDPNDPSTEICNDLAIRPSGEFLCAGEAALDAPGSVTRALLLQFTAAGQLDTGWGEDGFFFPEQQAPAGESHAYAVALHANGELLVAGEGIFPTQVSLLGVEGSVYSEEILVNSLATQNDGKFVAAVDPIVLDTFISLRFELDDEPAGDTTPDAFRFDDVVGTPASTWIESEEILITGLTSPANVTIAGGEYSIDCDGTWNDSSDVATIDDDESICVRHQSSATTGETTTTTLTIGGVEGTFSSTTGDAAPNAFAFTDVTNVQASSVQTSAAVTISGIDIVTPISVVGGAYSVGCTGTFTTDPGGISAGETVCVRHTASTQASTTVSTVLTVGNVSDSFSSTTSAGNATPGGGGAGEPGDIGGGWNGGAGGSGSFDGLMLLGLLLGGGVMLARRRQRHN